MAELIKCDNCERVIGNLETPFVHEGHVVCAECWSRLGGVSQQATTRQPRTDPLVVPRWVVLFLAIAMSFMADRTIAYMLWGAWIVMGIVGLAFKAL